VAETGVQVGRVAASVAVSRVLDRPRWRARKGSGPAMSIALIWLIVAVRSRSAEVLVVRSTRSASTSPSAPFGAAPARPDRTASAAE